ncbi:MAG: LysE family transporter [Candidatus Nitrosocaldus sp.]
MDYTFLLMVVAVSSSGVLSPGPLFLINLHYAKRYGHVSGILCASGHAAVELPLILAIAIGILSMDYINQFRWLIGLVGGIALIAFATMQLYTMYSRWRSNGKGKDGSSSNSSSNGSYGSSIYWDRIEGRVSALHGSLLAGIVFSALNPFFIVWWLTVGAKMIADAWYMASIQGVLIMFLAHIWMDYAWLGCTAYMARKGIERLHNKRPYIMLYIALYAMLVYIGAGFIASSI